MIMGKILIVRMDDKCGREVEECVEILDVAVMVDKHEMEIAEAILKMLSQLQQHQE